jgi:hypothetical protein
VAQLSTLGDIAHHETILHSSSGTSRGSDGRDDIFHAGCSLGYFRVCRLVRAHCHDIWPSSVFVAKAEGATPRLSLGFYVALKGSVLIVVTIIYHARIVRRKIIGVKSCLPSAVVKTSARQVKSGGSFIWAMRALTPSPAMFQKGEASKIQLLPPTLHQLMSSPVCMERGWLKNLPVAQLWQADSG